MSDTNKEELEEIIKSIADLFDKPGNDPMKDPALQQLKEIQTECQKIIDSQNGNKIVNDQNHNILAVLENKIDALKEIPTTNTSSEVQEKRKKVSFAEGKPITVIDPKHADAQINSLHHKPLLSYFDIKGAHYENGPRRTPLRQKVKFYINSIMQDREERRENETNNKPTLKRN